MQERERRQALADFLRRRRASLSPAAVGLPAGVRRRTPGLRREEVAELANIGTSWYVWLEQARDVHPSADVLDSIAQAFKFTLNERRHLFLLAGQPLPPHLFPVEEQVSPTLQRVLNDLNPTPAYVMGRRWDYLAWNNAAACVLSLDQLEPPHTYNLIWQTFTNPITRERHANWGQVAQAVLSEFRTSSARYPGDAWFDELIEDLKQASPEFCQWWPHHDASSSQDGHKVIEHQTLGHLEFEHLTLQIPSDPDVRVMIYSPDDSTRAKLEDYRTRSNAVSIPR
jgi:transcriptional regulator with XRE-family HTH domain